MPQNTELYIYVGKDENDQQVKLYTAENATEPLPSHILVLNHDVACKLVFQLKSGFNDTFTTTGYLEWSNGTPDVSGEGRSSSGDQVWITVTNDNSGSSDEHYGFKLHLTTHGEVVYARVGGITIDPTIVEKPGGAGF